MSIVWAVVKGDILTSLAWFVVYFVVALGVSKWKQRRTKPAPRMRTFDNSWKAWQMRLRDRRQRHRRWGLRRR